MSLVPSPPRVWPSEEAPEKTKRLWQLHGCAHSKKYRNPDITSLGALLRHNALELGDQTAFLYPASSVDDPEYKSISWGDFDAYTSALAEKYAARLESILTSSRLTREQPTVALMGRGYTMEYWATQMALQKLNLRVLLLAENLSVPALDHLLEVTKSKVLIVDGNLETPIRHKSIIPMAESPILQRTSHEQRYEALAFEDGKDPWERHSFIIHSSGSTGLPKPVYHTNRSLMLTARMYRLFPDLHIENWLLLFPLFHIAGLSIVLSGLPNGCITSLPPRTWPPRASAVLRVCETLSAMGHPVECIHTAPIVIESIVEQIERSTRDFAPLSRLKILQPGGAMLSSNLVSKLVCHGVNVKTTYGSTEIGPPFRSIPHNKENRECYRLANLYPENDKIRMEEVGGGLYECVVYNGFELAADLWKGPDDTTPYRTKDLFVQNPPNSGYFYLEGRIDDVLIHTTGENTNASPIESAIKSRCNKIESLVLIGHGKPCTALLVQLKTTDAGAVADVHRAVSKTNALYPRHSSILQSMIYILSEDERLPVTLKGNVRRKAAEEQFQHVIEGLYTPQDSSGNIASSTPKIPGHLVRDAVRKAVSKITSRDLTEADNNKRLYDLGIDSISAIRLRNELGKIGAKLTLGAIFEYPSINLLSEYVRNEDDATRIEDKKTADATLVQRLIDRYRKKIYSLASVSSRPPPPLLPHTECESVLLTGASGSLGTALIVELARSPKVSKIFALIRGSEPIESLQRSMRGKCLDFDTLLQTGKLEVLRYDMSDPKLGLGQDYRTLVNKVTTVIHSAWMMDFNKNVNEYEKCIQSVIYLLGFCVHGRTKRFAFVSSIAACMGAKAPISISEMVAAESDALNALRTGYAQSKFIVERMCQDAYDHLKLPVMVLRLGQMYGHSGTGVWNTQEMFPIMIASSLQIGALPSFPPSTQIVDWIPVDVAAATMHDIVTAFSSTLLADPNDKGTNVPTFNIVNPNPITWSNYLDKLLLALEEAGYPVQGLKTVSMVEWTDRLRQAGGLENPKDDGRPSPIPGLKLFHFFEEMATLSILPTPLSVSSPDSDRSAAATSDASSSNLSTDGKSGLPVEARTFQTSKTRMLSPALKNCKAVNGELLGRCIERWKKSGFL